MSFNFTNAFKGAAGAAGTGAAIGSFVPGGAAVGAGIGALTGLFAGGLEKSDEEVRRERFDAYVKRLNELRLEGMKRINQMRTQRVSLAQQGAARRALSMGQSSEAESMMIPAVANIDSQSNDALGSFTSNMDAQQLSAEADFANRPIESNISDTLLELGNAGLSYMQNMEYLKRMKTATPKVTVSGTTTSPVTQSPAAISGGEYGLEPGLFPPDPQGDASIPKRLLGEKFPLFDTIPTTGIKDQFNFKPFPRFNYPR